MNQSRQGSFDVQELMDSEGSSSAVEGDERFQDEVMQEPEGHEGGFEMGQDSGGEEGDDEGAESISNYSEDLNLDNEIKLGGFSDSEDGDSEFDDWKAFDEEEELGGERSDEDTLRKFEEMMGDEEYAELWSTRWYSMCHALPLLNNIFSYRKWDPHGRRSRQYLRIQNSNGFEHAPRRV